MRTNLAGRALLGLGVTIGVAATVAWFVGFDPTTLPPALLRIAAFKLTGLAAFGLMAAGATVIKFSRGAEQGRGQSLSGGGGRELNAENGAVFPAGGVSEPNRATEERTPLTQRRTNDVND